MLEVCTGGCSELGALEPKNRNQRAYAGAVLKPNLHCPVMFSKLLMGTKISQWSPLLTRKKISKYHSFGVLEGGCLGRVLFVFHARNHETTKPQDEHLKTTSFKYYKFLYFEEPRQPRAKWRKRYTPPLSRSRV